MESRQDRLDISSIAPSGTLRRLRGSGRPGASAELGDREPVSLDITNLFDAPLDPRPMRRRDLEALAPEALDAHRRLREGRGDFGDAGTPMLGWMDLPERIPDEKIEAVRRVAEDLAGRVDAYVSIGIGGSYLGIEATVRALTHTHFNSLTREQRGGAPEVHFLGQNMDPDFFRDTLDLLHGKRVAIHVISKSGTTTETAIAFRVMRRLLERSCGEAARGLVLVTTDARRGALRGLADREGYTSFVVPDDIGGRFSLLSDVGLVGMAVAGVDIGELVAGARHMKRRTDRESFWENPALVHAAARTLAWRHGKKVEVVATNSTALYQVARFMEQLFPESEGHGGKGLWVSPSLYSEKLHANGQMVQQGERNLLETFLRLGRNDSRVEIPVDPEDMDGFNFLPERGMDLGGLNDLAVEGPAWAHFAGGVPNMTIHVPARSAHCLGQLYYLLERSVAISGTLLGHNPFVQPGVVDYKQAMFALAGRPGLEEERARMENLRRARERVVVR